MGYEQRKIALPEITDGYLSIALRPQPLQLQEMVVKPLDPLDIVGLSLDRIPENYLSIPYKARGFQREYVTANEQFIQLMEVTFLTQATRDPGATRVLDARYLENKREKAPLWDPSRGGFYTFGWTKALKIESPSQSTF